MAWHHSDTLVLDGVTNPSGAIDLSAVVGRQRALVLLRVVGSGAVEVFRAHTTTGSRSADLVNLSASRTIGWVITATNQLGVTPDVSGTGTFDVYVQGYAPATIPDNPVSIFGPAAPGSWKQANTSAVEPGSALGLFRWAHSAGSAVDGKTRVDGDTDEHGAGANTVAITSAAPEALSVSSVNDDGGLELLDPGANSVELFCEALVTHDRGFQADSSLLWSAANPPLAWATLDLSAKVGANRVLALLKVTCVEDQPDDQYVSFIPNGVDTTSLPASADGLGVGSCFVEFLLSGYVLVETDASGIVQWRGTPTRDVTVQLLGWIESGDPITTPTTTETDPSGLTTSLTRIFARCTDDYGFDTDTTSLSMTDSRGVVTPIITDGVFESGWSGSVIGLQVGENGPLEVLVNVTGWPDGAVPNGERVTFDLSIENIYGVSP